MFAGHFSLATAVATARPRMGLANLVAASYLLDLVCAPMLILGLERVRVAPGHTAVMPVEFVSYPFSHGLLAAAGWALVYMLGYLASTRQGRRRQLLPGVLLAAVVLSHWPLDVLTHAPDMPLLGDDSPKYGLGLWNSPWGTAATELTLLFGSAWLFLSRGPALTPRGRTLFKVQVLLLSLVQLSSFFRPPPPSADIIGLAGLVMWLIVAWAAWVDSHRGEERQREVSCVP